MTKKELEARVEELETACSYYQKEIQRLTGILDDSVDRFLERSD